MKRLHFLENIRCGNRYYRAGDVEGVADGYVDDLLARGAAELPPSGTNPAPEPERQAQGDPQPAARAVRRRVKKPGKARVKKGAAAATAQG